VSPQARQTQGGGGVTTEPTPKIEHGQIWVPKTNAPGGGGVLRIVCHYDFKTHEGQEMWVVEYMNYINKLERMDQVALLSWWRLAEEE
jgi:hypothetical protein